MSLSQEKQHCLLCLYYIFPYFPYLRFINDNDISSPLLLFSKSSIHRNSTQFIRYSSVCLLIFSCFSVVSLTSTYIGILFFLLLKSTSTYLYLPYAWIYIHLFHFLLSSKDEKQHENCASSFPCTYIMLMYNQQLNQRSRVTRRQCSVVWWI